MKRREFFTLLAAPAWAARMSHRERVDRALRGQEVDRNPFTFWYHFGLEKEGASRHAQATLDFHRKFRTDLVKVMSDFPFPTPHGKWHEVRVEQNPFPEQLKALELVRSGLAESAHFVETIFNPWNVAEKLSSPQEVLRMKTEHPGGLLAALEAIAQSEANHARRALSAGASGVFLAIANAQDGILSPADYAKFSEPFDRMVLQAASGAPLNILHLHGDKVYLDRFLKGWPAAAINYSTHGTGVKIASVRGRYQGVILGGLDERNFRSLTSQGMREQWQAARQAAGAKFILTPGCSVPNETTDEELLRLAGVVGA